MRALGRFEGLFLNVLGKDHHRRTAPRDRAFEPARAAALLTAWLVEELGSEALINHPDAYALWLPHGLDPDDATWDA